MRDEEVAADEEDVGLDAGEAMGEGVVERALVQVVVVGVGAAQGCGGRSCLGRSGEAGGGSGGEGDDGGPAGERRHGGSPGGGGGGRNEYAAP